MAKKQNPIYFNPTDEDRLILERISAHLGVSVPAVFRLALRSKAIEIGVWAPPALDSGDGTEEAATGTEG